MFVGSRRFCTRDADIIMITVIMIIIMIMIMITIMIILIIMIIIMITIMIIMTMIMMMIMMGYYLYEAFTRLARDQAGSNYLRLT